MSASLRPADEAVSTIDGVRSLAHVDAESYSVPGNPRAAAFASFAVPYLRGRVLDVGCGLAPVPLYLARHPLAQVTGIDPVVSTHPFLFRQAQAEALPFDAGVFETVICATVLDHLAHPSHVALALREIRRVLVPGGQFISWETTVPEGSGASAGDEFHRYRFTNDWLFARWSDFFQPVALEWYRDGMRRGCAELWSVWMRA